MTVPATTARPLDTPDDAALDRFLILVAGGADLCDAAAEAGGWTPVQLRRYAAKAGRRDDYDVAVTAGREITQAYVRKSLRRVAETAMDAESQQLSAANRALELLGKDARMFADRVEVDVDVDVEVTVTHDPGRILRQLADAGVIQLGPAWPDVAGAAVDAADAPGERVLPAPADGAADSRPGGAPVPA